MERYYQSIQTIIQYLLKNRENEKEVKLDAVQEKGKVEKVKIEKVKVKKVKADNGLVANNQEKQQLQLIGKFV